MRLAAGDRVVHGLYAGRVSSVPWRSAALPSANPDLTCHDRGREAHARCKRALDTGNVLLIGAGCRGTLRSEFREALALPVIEGGGQGADSYFSSKAETTADRERPLKQRGPHA